ncbi:GINS complex subunit [Linnemannia gamsii]|uniref:DNA replication complex GINS protein SLD5 n=1 Tax=Linnemannia gamsii TaxID=64522 RepID=A0A9P6RD72_9FUNG|nr:GINS complex subunit [Linnemannia gamsii]
MSDDDDFNFSGYNDRISASREPDVEAIDPAGDVAHLTQAWIDERAAPDLLQYQEQCIQRLLAKIEEQTLVIEELDPRNDTSVILSILYQTELERVKFILRSYLRTRISKIERFCAFVLQDAATRKRLSRAELHYAEKATRQHYQNSFLSSLPQSLQSQDADVFSRNLSMVSQPSLDEAVFCRIIDDIGDFQLDDYETVELNPGQIYIFRYRTVRTLLQHRRIQLI